MAATSGSGATHWDVLRHRPLLAVVVAVGLAACSSSGGSRSPSSTRTAPSPTPSTVPVAAGVTPTGDRVDHTLVTPDERTRTYRSYVPSGLLPDVPVPLVVALHGGTGWGTQFETNSGFDSLAEANHFIVVYPDGVGVGANGAQLRTWNGGTCCGAAARQAVDDVGFVGQLIDAMEQHYAIDRHRVYVVGHSNGAILGERLACELSDRIVAIGVQAGSLGIDHCRPTRPVSALMLHGTADQNVPIDGGVGARSIAGVSFRSPRRSAAILAGAMGCPHRPRAAVERSNPDLRTTTWSPCRQATTVEFVAVRGAPHAWMGHPSPSPALQRVVGVPYPGLDASRTIWTFLAQQRR